MTEQIEQKAEKYAKNLLKDVTCNIGHPRTRQINSIDIEDAWLYGYKEGFKDCQKEHEWHYVKNKLPPSGETVLLYFGTDIMGKAIMCTGCVDCKGNWYKNVDKEPFMWQEIILPKENE